MRRQQTLALVLAAAVASLPAIAGAQAVDEPAPTFEDVLSPAAEDTVPPMVDAAAPTVQVAAPPPADALPPMRFAGSVARDEILARIRANPRFAALSTELPGSPLLLRVTRSFELTAGGKAAGFASALLAGGSLGLLPMVTNQDVVITYEIVVNGVPLVTWSASRNITRAQNIYATDTTYGLGDEGLKWAIATADEFAAAVDGDPKIAALIEEYRYYFAAPGQAG